MQYWPRKRAARPYAKVRAWPKSKEAQALGFAGYKVGMTHVLMTDNRKESTTKDMEISVPVTIIECPPIKVLGARLYKKVDHELNIIKEVQAKGLDKNLSRKICVPKKESGNILEDEDFDEARIIVHTQPSLAGIGKKKPEIFEVGLGGKKAEQITFINDNLGKEIKVDTLFKPGDQLDIHSVTKGKGFQGAVKRFGIKIRQHKAEKTKRGAGSLGGWKAQGHVMYRVPAAGQMGYHMRTEYNKWLLKIGDTPKEVNPKGGFIHYGEIKSTFILVKGSVAGATKRLIIFSRPMRPSTKIPGEAPDIGYISTDSKQR